MPKIPLEKIIPTYTAAIADCKRMVTNRVPVVRLIERRKCVFLSFFEAMRTLLMLQKVQKNSTEDERKPIKAMMYLMNLVIAIRFVPF